MFSTLAIRYDIERDRLDTTGIKEFIYTIADLLLPICPIHNIFNNETQQ